MFFIIFISLLSYHAINYSSFEESNTPPRITITQPNSPISPKSKRLLIRNVPIENADNPITYNTNDHRVTIHTNSKDLNNTALNSSIEHQYSTYDTDDNDPHKIGLKIICGCAIIVIIIGGVTAIVTHSS